MPNRFFGIKRRFVAFFLFTVAIGMPGLSPACTSFSLSHENGPVVGANFDGAVSDGLIVVNKKGRILVHTGETLPVKALANDPYARSVDNLGNFIGFGGHRKIPEDNTSYCRFARTADMLQRFDGRDAAATMEYAFKILDCAAYKNHPRTKTQWSMAFDLTTRTIFLKTSLNPTRRKIEMKAFDYLCPAIPETLDIHSPLNPGSRNGLEEYNYERNRGRFFCVFSEDPTKKKSNQERLERISRYPETFVCENVSKKVLVVVYQSPSG